MARIVKLEKAIMPPYNKSQPLSKAVIEALQALRGVAQTTAATIVSELGRYPASRVRGADGAIAA